MTKRKSFRKGFTLIELLVVIAIILILASILGYTVSGIMNLGEQTQCLAKMKKIAGSFTAFAGDHNGILPGGPDWKSQGTFIGDPSPWRGSWIGKEVVESTGIKLAREYKTSERYGVLLEYMDKGADEDLSQTYRCPSLDFIEIGCGRGSNSAFDFSAAGCFYGAPMSSIPPTAKYKDYSTDEYVKTATPLLLEEDPAMALNINRNELETTHCNRDQFALTHGNGSNTASVDGSAHRIKTNANIGCRAKDWRVKAPSGQEVNFDVCSLRPMYGVWVYK